MRRKRVAIVEDEKELNDFYNQLLLADGFETVQLFSGFEAYKHLKNNSVDIVSTGILMPEIDGIELIQLLYINSVNKNTPIVVISNFASQTAINKAYELGITSYLIKSEVSIDDYRQAIKEGVDTVRKVTISRESVLKELKEDSLLAEHKDTSSITRAENKVDESIENRVDVIKLLGFTAFILGVLVLIASFILYLFNRGLIMIYSGNWFCGCILVFIALSLISIDRK